MDIIFLIVLFLKNLKFINNSNNFSFGFETGIIFLSELQNKDSSNKFFRLNINSFLKLHYFSKFDKKILENFNKDNSILQFNLNDYDINIQRARIWGKELEEFLKKETIDKFSKMIDTFKSKDFRDKKNYLKNQFKLLHSNDKIEILYDKKFEEYLYKLIFPKVFSENITKFTIRIKNTINDFKEKLKWDNFIEKKDSNCKNPFECRMSQDYYITKAKINDEILKEFNSFLQTEIKEVVKFNFDIPLENTKVKDNEYNGFYIIEEDFSNDNNNFKNLKKKGNNNFYILFKIGQNKNDFWKIDNLSNFLRSDFGRKDDL